jgi:hypothetical protein
MSKIVTQFTNASKTHGLQIQVIRITSFKVILKRAYPDT